MLFRTTIMAFDHTIMQLIISHSIYSSSRRRNNWLRARFEISDGSKIRAEKIEIIPNVAKNVFRIYDFRIFPISKFKSRGILLSSAVQARSLVGSMFQFPAISRVLLESESVIRISQQRKYPRVCPLSSDSSFSALLSSCLASENAVFPVNLIPTFILLFLSFCFQLRFSPLLFLSCLL